MRALVVGVGAVGARTARQLVSTDVVDEVFVRDRDPERAKAVAASLGTGASAADGSDPAVDVAVLAMDCGDHAEQARALVRRGTPVVSTADAIGDVRALLDLDAEARERGVSIAVGAGFAPGLACVLARHGAEAFETVDEIHVAKHGTGGPACARQHHQALARTALDWRDGGWVQRPGGSGRELCWFPDPVASADCYRAALADALLLVPAFPGVKRVTARVSATRRDRLTAHLPMLRPPHPEGTLGAVRVELRGLLGGQSETRVFGAVDRPAVGAGAVAAVAAVAAAHGELRRFGAAGIAELVEPLSFLDELHRRGVRAAVFEGLTF